MAKKHIDRNERADHKAGTRGSYESARRRILATATVCGICGRPIDKSLKYPDPMSATVDHIIPLSKGGHPFALENLQAAHRCCNREKSDRILPIERVTTEPQAYNNRDLPQSADWRVD